MSYGRCQSPIYLPRLPGNLPAFSSYRTYLMFIGQLGKLTQGVATALYAAAHASRGGNVGFYLSQPDGTSILCAPGLFCGTGTDVGAQRCYLAALRHAQATAPP